MIYIMFLRAWLKKLYRLFFAVSMIWREPKDHLKDCYFCLTHILGITAKSEHGVQYPDLPLALKPVLYGEKFLVLRPPGMWNADDAK
jgi:hypothetical protein